ncbi:MAG: helix-turn-helix domain-containing protein, partial [Lachnospiraceae bacterium]|nr:helix-turn-helix domain-containing protein [Lachnospiraceae bacterium]
KLFHAQLGKSYSDYFAVIKLKHVQHLLLSTDKSITEIAFDTGYRHVSNLSEQFKKMTGMSPLQYRKLQ